MNFEEMTVEEIIEYFCEKQDNEQQITLQELQAAVDACSVIDPVAAESAITIFYSGGEDAIANVLSDSGNENIRILRRTDRYKLLGYVSEIDKDQSFDQWIKDAIDLEYGNLSEIEKNKCYTEIMYGVSESGSDCTSVGSGFWTQASAEFAADTKGNVYALIENACENRIFARDELKQFFNSIDMDNTINGIKKADLTDATGADLFNLLKEKTIQEFSGADVYLNTNGEKVGTTFRGTAIEGIVDDLVPENSGRCIKVSNSQYLELSKLDVNELRNAIQNSEVYLNETGEVIGRNYSGTVLEDILTSETPENYTYKTSGRVFEGLSSEEEMLTKYGLEYNALTPSEKYQLKEIEYFNRIMENAGETDDLEKTVMAYLQASGKRVEELTEFERKTISICAEFNKRDSAFFSKVGEWIETIQNSKKFINVMKAAEGIGVLATGIVVGYTIYDTVKRADEAIQNKDYGKTAGIVTGSCADLLITFLGGEEIAGALMPYLSGVGMALGGPLGALIGGTLAVVAGFGIAETIGDMADDMLQGFGSLLDSLYDSAMSVVRYVADPLVLDMDGDGFETLSVGNGVYFDEDATGLAEKTAWVSGDDALLAVDLNGNGKIDDGSELFGTATVLGNGEKAESGFAALMQYDSNGDGVIDESDEMYARLMIWQDKNSDGKSQNEELVSLKDAGIVSISLETDEESGRNVSVVTFTDGITRKLGEFDFDAQYYNTVEKEETVVSVEIQALPDIQAIGSVESLHTLMQKDESGTLKGYVEKFQSAQTTEEREDLVTKILYFVTGAAQVDVGSRGSEMDAQKLMVVEKFMGRDFVGTQGANPVNTAASILNNMYAEIFQAYYSLLNAQSHLSNYVKMTCIMEKEDGTKVINTEMFDAFIKLCRENGADMTEQVAEMGRYIRYMNFENQDNFHSYLKNYEVDDTYLRSIVGTCYPSAYYGTDTANTYSGSDADEAFMAGAGDDVIYARTGNDIIYGESGNDNIYAENGDDIIVGGTGNDDLNGGYGNDTYIFHKGDGADTIIDYECSTTAGKDDKIVFGEGILPEEVTMERIGDDLLIQYGEGDQITVRDAYYYSDGRYQIESMVFADGTVWKQEDIAVRCNTRHGSDGNDTMSTYSAMQEYDDNETFYAGAGNDTVYAGDGNDTIYAGSGDDTVYGGSGDDIIDGGSGSDYLNGGYGNDTYIFHKGDGADTIIDYECSTTAGKDDKIVFGEGILPEDVTMERIGDDLLIQYGEGDQITVRDAYYYSDGRYQVESMAFSDQSKYSINYSDTELVLMEAGIQNQEELITDVSEEASVDEMVTSISDISQENALINAEDGIITDSADILVESMANLAVQELSEVSTENVSEASNFANVVVQDDNVQLWVE